MTIPAIRKITLLCNDGTYETYEHGVRGVTEILDKSLEYESSLHPIYYIMKGETLAVELVNISVIIEHFN